jgi:hypothetical protein
MSSTSNQKSYNIAISIVDKIDVNHLYSNGISQNIVLLYELFELLGHAVFLVVITPRENQKLRLNNNKQFNASTLEELKQNQQSLDLFFEAGSIQGKDVRNLIKLLGAKIISVHYGNSLIMDMEHILYRDEKDAGFQHIADGVDYIWISPHHAYHQSYLEILYSASVSTMPFVWNPKFIQNKKFSKKDFRAVSNIYVMEPNISVVKNALIPMTIIEALYRKNPDSFHQAFVINGACIKDKSYFLNNIVNSMPSLNASVVKDKVFFSERCQFDDVFTHPDVLLSHHWNNGLNYLSLEALYHNIPLVHNSEFFQEVGYFYPDFDVHQGAEALEDALLNHKANFVNHKSKNQEFLKQFSIYNPKVQQQYQQLLTEIISNENK